MAKISPMSSKYIIHSAIEIEGVVDRPDVIGAIFGQTEGLLGSDLELRELQRSGRIGRIEVNVETRSGKTAGKIIIPSSLDKAETSIVAAALEIIQRIGPCNAKIRVENIEDVRVSKRKFVIERAKELLRNLMENVLPYSQELAEEVTYSVRVMEITEYGKDRLPAGPSIDESDEVIVVEGRADVLNLLKHGIKNVIAINGTSVPETLIELSKKKVLTAFVDGDRGGDLILRELIAVADMDFVTKAPDGKEVEEITKKEIHKALRNKIATEQIKLEIARLPDKPTYNVAALDKRQQQPQQQFNKPVTAQTSQTAIPGSGTKVPAPAVALPPKKVTLTPQEKKTFDGMLEDLIGTRGAYILDEKLNILGKVPITELATTVKSLSTGVYAVVLDGFIDKDLLSICERSTIRYLVAMDAKIRPTGSRISVITTSDL